MNRLIENEMKAPTREEVLTHFKDVTKVRCITNKRVDIYSNEIKEGLCGWWSMNNTLLWNKDKGYAKIIEKVVNAPKHESKAPKHYKTNSIDVIDFCKLYNLNFNLGNVIKYTCRADKKGTQIQDLKKAIDYLERELKHLDN